MFYGVYKASGISGCPHSFITVGVDELRFPPAMTRLCAGCALTHAFAFDHAIQADSPAQRTNLTNYCERNKIETSVSF